MIRERGLFDPKSNQPFKVSRSKLENFTQCPRCFYLDRRLGLSRPGMPAFTLNSAVDTLLKKEFDIHRVGKSAHPIMDAYGVDAIPYEHEQMEDWRRNFHGVQYLYEPTNFLMFGAVDDIWVNPAGDLIVVDYKSTSKDGEIDMNDKWKAAYKRQMEIYQWLLRGNGFKVARTGYFVYANGSTANKAFDAKLEFKLTLHAHEGDDSWVEQAVLDAKKCLMAEELPVVSPDCEHCQYRMAARKLEPNV